MSLPADLWKRPWPLNMLDDTSHSVSVGQDIPPLGERLWSRIRRVSPAQTEYTIDGCQVCVCLCVGMSCIAGLYLREQKRAVLILNQLWCL